MKLLTNNNYCVNYKNSGQVKRLKLETMIGYKMGATMKHLSGFMVTAKQKKVQQRKCSPPYIGELKSTFFHCLLLPGFSPASLDNY